MNVIDINNPEYQELFSEELKELLEAIEVDIISYEVEKTNQIRENIKRNLHTLKGNFKIYGIDSCVEKIHNIETNFETNDNDDNVVTSVLEFVSEMRDNYNINKEGAITKKISENNDNLKIMIDFQGKTIENFDLDRLKIEIKTLGDLKNIEFMGDNIPEYSKFDPKKLYIKLYIEIENTNKDNVIRFLDEIVDKKFYKIVGKSKKDKTSKENKIDINENPIEKGIISENIIENKNELIEDNNVKEEVKSPLDEQIVKTEIILEENNEKTKESDEIFEKKSIEKSEKENYENNYDELKIDSAQDKIVNDIKKGINTIRVNTNKLDSLVNIAGELIVAHSRLKEFNDYIDTNLSEEFSKVISDLDIITKELQENVLSVRMIPIGTTFLQFKRMVRDLSKQLNKNVNLEIYGGETEIDKTIVEKIIDPLRHIIRNAIDHGVEDTVEERIKNGKSAEALIRLNSFYQGGEVIIEVLDDGRGLNREKILKTAIRKNIISANDKLADNDIKKLILHAGFSTRNEVTEISGRGVGMDVVKNNIESIGGKIDIESDEGKNTCFKIRLPLTLAIIDGMLVKVGDNIYIVPILSIVESVQPKKENIKQFKGKKEIIDLRGEYFSLIKLYNIFKIDNAIKDPTNATILIVETYRGKAAIMVDEVLDTQQIVIKKIGIKDKEVDKFSGATILGNGEVALILDLKNIHDSIYE